MGTSNNMDIESEFYGILPRTIEEIFSEVESRKMQSEFIIKLSFIEIYNEDIYDLLDKNRKFINNFN